MDKAKKLAEQAQQKIEETQEQFNSGQQAGGTASAGSVQQYDSAGRPVASEAPPPAPAPAPAAASAEPQESTETKPHGDPLTADAPHAPKPPATPASGDAPDRGEDGDYTPPKLSSGDPLAG